MPAPKPTPIEERFYLVPDFCETFGVRRSSAYDAMKDGRLLYVTGVDGKRRIRASTAKAFVLGGQGKVA
jgi:hypothetical protein